MTTLFQFVTLDDWSAIARVVTARKPELEIFFIFYIMLTAFTVLSLLTGVVAEHMLDVSRKEEDNQEKEKHEELKAFLAELEELFQLADADNSGTISREEF